MHSPRIKNPRSKYYVSSNLWNEDYYPKYVSGGGFVMTKNAALGIFKGIFFPKNRMKKHCCGLKNIGSRERFLADF